LKLRGINVLATDLLESRLKLAKQFGARWTSLVQRQKSKTRSHRSSTSDFGHRILDSAIIAVPSDEAVTHALQSVRGGGQILLFAHTKPDDWMKIDLSRICLNEKDLIGSYSSDFTIQTEVARLVFSRALDVRSLITDRFELKQTADAIHLAANPAENSLKIIVKSASA
jgi:L-iditol 2-dehydrogenase